MASQPGYQTITIYILPNISRSKSNQTLKFGQVIEYNKNRIGLHENANFICGAIQTPQHLLNYRL